MVCDVITEGHGITGFGLSRKQIKWLNKAFVSEGLGSEEQEFL